MTDRRAHCTPERPGTGALIHRLSTRLLDASRTTFSSGMRCIPVEGIVQKNANDVLTTYINAILPVARS
jgi:hypothetical protein